MNKSELIYRRITYSLFIILFLIVTPLIIFYTQGYRFNFKNQHIQQTGILVISSNPKKADITLNDKYTEKNTPTRLENLMPGNYNIKLSKPGYYSWEKKLPIYENYTSFAENILLWKQTTSSPLTNIASSGQIAISPNKQDAYFIDNKGSLNFLDTASASYQAIASLGIGTIIESYDWNIGGYKTLLKTKNNKNQIDYYLLTNGRYFFSNINLTKITSLIPPQTTIARINNAGTIIFALAGSNLWQIDLIKKQNSIILKDKKISDYLINNDTIYAINEKQLIAINKNKTIRQLSQLDFNDGKFLTSLNSDRLVIANLEKANGAIIDLSGNDSPIAINITGASWLNKDVILFNNDFEVWLYDINKNNPEIITRLGKQIKTTAWHPLGRHIIIATDDNIKIIEIDNRELRNVVNLAIDNTSEINNLITDTNGQNLYFTGSINKQNKLIYLNIR